MEAGLEISLDKLPMKRVDAIDENGYEHFPSAVGYDEKRLNLIRRIDFAWAVEREDPSKKQKIKEDATSAKEVTATMQKPWEWQSLVEDLQLAHQELLVIIGLIDTVESNDALTVASMVLRPKQLPNELLSDLAVSTATKLQCFRHLGKYFKQSAKALEEQIVREARFYGALIRLQQNWKVKRHRLIAAASGNEGFYIDLFDSSIYDLAAPIRPSSMSTIPVKHDASGMLSVNLPRKSCHSLRFEILGSGYNVKKSSKIKTQVSDSFKGTVKESHGDDHCVREINLTLREVHKAIHEEQIFELINRKACNPSLGINLTGLKENYLRLSASEGASVSIALVSSGQDDKKVSESDSDHMETSDMPLASFDESKFAEGLSKEKKVGIPNQVGFEIYLRQLFHEYVFVNAKNKTTTSSRSQIPGQPLKDSSDILSHFCMSLAQRIFSNKVLSVLEKLVYRTPCINLVSHSTWYSRMFSWILSMKVPQSILHGGSQIPMAEIGNLKNIRSQFWTKVVVIDDSITIEGEGAPNIVSLFKGKSDGICPVNGYECDLAELPMILLQQVASQIIQWLYEEALIVSIKASRDFLSLALELKLGEIVRLVAHVDPEDTTQGCISWWLILDNDGLTDDHNLNSELLSSLNGDSESRKFLGYLSLDQLYSTLLDLLNLC